MYCHICGKELDSHSKFCHHCGTAIPLIEKHIISQETVNEDLNVSTTNSQEKTTTKKVETPKVRILWDNICQHKYIAFSILAIILIVILNFTIEEKDVKNIPSTTMEETTTSSHEVEDERWDAESGTYANFKYGIAFNLTRGVSWERVSGTAKHTVVKFLQPDSGLTMYANIYPLGAGVPSDNIWDIYSEFIMSLHCANEQLGDIIYGWAYVGYYIGLMSLAVITSLIISLTYFVITKRFWRIFFNSLWITSVITYLFAS